MKKTLQKKRVAVIGGGAGTFVTLTALKPYALDLSAIVSMADNGGSTGALRDQYGVLPPGDVRRALVALSPDTEIVRALFNHRFETGSLRGHSFGNIFLSTAEQVTSDFGTAITVAARVLGVRGAVLPVTQDRVRLMARLEDGTVISGESAIDMPRTRRRSPIQRVWLSPQGRADRGALKAICDADMIIIGPGDLYTSVIPNFLVPGIKDAVMKSKAKKVFVVNLMTKRGETDGFSVEDFLNVFEQYAGSGVVDVVLANNARISPQVLSKYKKEGAVPVRRNMVDGKSPRILEGKFLDVGDIVRHHPSRLGEAIIKLI